MSLLSACNTSYSFMCRVLSSPTKKTKTTVLPTKQSREQLIDDLGGVGVGTCLFPWELLKEDKTGAWAYLVRRSCKMLALEPSPPCTQEIYSLIVICKTGATVNSNMSLQSDLRPDRGEPFNNIYYFYCMGMRCAVALVSPLLLCYPQGLNAGSQASMASAFTQGSTSMFQMWNTLWDKYLW